MTTILAIEPSIRGGSISLYRDGGEIGRHIGPSGVSRAEDLLLDVADLLSSLQIDKREISQLAVSVGPGSFTGLRIGIATMLGLSAALGIPVIGVPLFEAMTATVDDLDGCAAAVPIGRSDIAWQQFSVRGAIVPISTPGSQFSDALAALVCKTIVVHPGVCDIVPAEDLKSFTIHDVGENLASLIAKGVERGSPDLTPIYLSSSAYRK